MWLPFDISNLGEVWFFWGVFATALALLFSGTFLYRFFTRKPVPEPQKANLGGVTLEALAHYSGYDWSKPLVVAVKGKIYDVSTSYNMYGPGNSLHAYAGKEAARAIAMESTAPEEIGSCVLHDLTADEVTRLNEEIAKFDAKYPVVGEVVPMMKLTAEDLSAYDGTDPSKPLYLAIQGVVYDITKGKHFYGPDGIYPFAGREVARAFALLSTELSDCTADVSGLSQYELDNLSDWKSKFNAKYPIIGRLVSTTEEQQKQHQEEQEAPHQ